MNLNDANRIIEVIDQRIRKMTKSLSRVETTWAEVASVSDDHRTVAAFLYGETDSEYTSDDFRTIHGVIPAVGDSIKVAMDKERSERWVEEVHVSSDYNRLEIVPNDGTILLGDGTTLPALGAADTYLKVNTAGDGVEYGVNMTPDFDVVVIHEDVSFDAAATFGFSNSQFTKTDTSEMTLSGDFVIVGNLSAGGDAGVTGSLTLGNNLFVTGGVVNFGAGGADAILYSPASGRLKTDEDFEAGSLAIGTNKVARYVRLSAFIQAVPDASTRTTDLTTPTAVAEMTGLPSTGVVAVQVMVGGRQSAVAVANVYAHDYDETTGPSGNGVGAYTGKVAGHYDFNAGMVLTGGTNNRQFKYSVAVGSGTLTYYIRVIGYWTTE